MHHIEHGMAPRRRRPSRRWRRSPAPSSASRLVLTAVFIPVACLGGLTGRLYQQFALTIAISVLISASTRSRLSPALARHAASSRAKPRARAARHVLRAGSTASSTSRPRRATSASRACSPASRSSASASWRWWCSCASRLAASRAEGFVPDEDQGLFMVNVQLPDGGVARADRRGAAPRREASSGTRRASSRSTRSAAWRCSPTRSSPRRLVVLVRLSPWHERTRQDTALRASSATCGASSPGCRRRWPSPSCRRRCPASARPAASTRAAGPQRHDDGAAARGARRRTSSQGTHQRPEVAAPSPRSTRHPAGRRRDRPREGPHARRPHGRASSTLSGAFGGAYVNDFNRFGRLYRVYVQADADTGSVRRTSGRSRCGARRPARWSRSRTLLTVNPSCRAPSSPCRFNLFRSIEVTGRRPRASLRPGDGGGRAGGGRDAPAAR